MLRRVIPSDVPALRRHPVDPDALRIATAIVDDVRRDGLSALRHHAERLGDIVPGAPLVVDRAALDRAADALPTDRRDVLERTAGRIRAFADAQRAALADLEVPVPGGRAGLRLAPVDRAGCYAPGGRFPLPSSVLMTAITARSAGVSDVWVASPRPAPETLAAAAIAGATALLACGGAHAIAALAWGAGEVPACDAIVGPGNKYVTAAKQLVAGIVAIDMLAGPTELVVVADGTADPAWLAADLLAQAEHDPEAFPVLIATDAAVLDAVDAELARQLADLPTAGIARAAIATGLGVLARHDELVSLCDRLAPEHLALHLADAEAVAARVRHYGAVFVGSGAAEVLGDYGAGPNHVLPTGGTARSAGALSVLTFLRAQVSLRMDDPRALARDAAALARMEGLEAHARAADRRASR